MIDYTLDTENSILYVRPKSRLKPDDFIKLASAVDPHIEKHGNLTGLIIEAETFPGWESFAAMASHFRFVQDHHRRIKRIAVVTDSALGAFAEKLASHFVAAEIRHFPAGERDAAARWVLGAP